MGKYDTEEFGWVNETQKIDYTNSSYISAMKYRDLIKGNVLDLGCGGGRHCYMFSEFESVNEIYGVDINLKQKEFAERQRKNGTTHDKVSFITSSVLDIGNLFEDDYFDCIYTFQSLEHWYESDLDTIIPSCKNLLKSSGHLIIIVPYEHAHDDGNHKTFWNEQSLKDKIESYEFSCVICEKTLNRSLIGVFK